MKTAAECIGEVEKDMSLFAVTRGQFSMIDCIRHCLEKMGPSRLTVWTWCIADYEFETFEWLLRAGGITEALLVIDRAGEQQVAKTRSFRDGSLDKSEKQGALMRRWKEKFGPDSIRVVLNHAKIATLDNGELKVVIRGSMNLNHNPRFEQLDITEGADVYGLVKEIEDGLPVLSERYSRREVEDATGAHCLFSDEELKPFRTAELKVWAK
jgi:hypothetical protein